MTRLEHESLAQNLDELVPLVGASHLDVVDYRVVVPMRYAEVSARLANGKTTCLANRKQFLGWDGYGSNPTLLFNCDDQRLVLDTSHERTTLPDLFIAPDGGQVMSANPDFVV
jgi:hypothetical protein